MRIDHSRVRRVPRLCWRRVPRLRSRRVPILCARCARRNGPRAICEAHACKSGSAAGPAGIDVARQWHRYMSGENGEKYIFARYVRVDARPCVFPALPLSMSRCECSGSRGRSLRKLSKVAVRGSAYLKVDCILRDERISGGTSFAMARYSVTEGRCKPNRPRPERYSSQAWARLLDLMGQVSGSMLS